MSAARVYLGDARSRLLPAFVPLRFFGAATVFHLLAWLALAAGSAGWAAAPAAMGWPLAALHLVTLGVLGMTAMGAGAQLLPVASRQHAPGPLLLTAAWWVYTLGVAVLALGMGMVRPALLAVGALAVTAGLAGWAALMLNNLIGARGMPGVVAHGWASVLSLVIVIATALALVGNWVDVPVASRETWLGLHRVFGPYGFMGMLALGLSSILVPMFALGDPPSDRIQTASCALAVVALLLGALGALGFAPRALGSAALLAGFAAVAIHLREMARVLTTGMRRELGRSFTLVKIGWAGLMLSLVLAAGVLLGAPAPRLATAFGLCLVGGWLLSFVLGLLQRILPFLAAMHGAGAGRRAPTPSQLTHDRSLQIHFVCHVTALAGLGLSVAADSAVLTAAAAVAGAAGALAFCFFYLTLLRRMEKPGALS